MTDDIEAAPREIVLDRLTRSSVVGPDARDEHALEGIVPGWVASHPPSASRARFSHDLVGERAGLQRTLASHRTLGG